MEPGLSIWGMQTSSYAPNFYVHRGKLVAQTIEEGTALHMQGCLIAVYTARWGFIFKNLHSNINARVLFLSIFVEIVNIFLKYFTNEDLCV